MAQGPIRDRICLEAAITIQSHLRRVLAVKLIKRRRQGLKHVGYLSSFQRLYRAKLAMRRYAALRRTVCADHRIHEAARFQGAMLRALGVRKRAMQRRMLQGLNFIGLNPISFDSRVHLLLLETLQEGVEFCRSATQKLLSLIENGYYISFLTLLNKSSIFGIYESSLLVSMQRSALVRKE